MKFEFSGFLLQFVGGARSVEVTAETLGDGLAALRTRYPQLGKVLLDDDGQLHRSHRICVGGEMLSRPPLDLPIPPAGKVTFMTAMAGG